MPPIDQNDRYDPVAGRPTLILGGHDFHSITEAVARPVEGKTPLAWWFFFLPSLALLGLLGVAVSWLFWEGIGIWGLNVPVGWAWDITNFVFWVGIGHAGTLISAILFLFRQKWRTSINRSAEAMTIFAVMCALIFPGIHVGRVWVAYFMFPIPNQMQMWPNFRSQRDLIELSVIVPAIAPSQPMPLSTLDPIRLESGPLAFCAAAGVGLRASGKSSILFRGQEFLRCLNFIPLRCSGRPGRSEPAAST